MGSFQDLLYRYNKTGSIPGAAFGDAIGQMVSGIPSQMPNAMGGVPTHGITANIGGAVGSAFKEGKEAAGDLFNRLLNRRMQNLGTGDLMGRMSGMG